ncbi:transporter [bacterium]|nr:transporter [bacterium]
MLDALREGLGHAPLGILFLTIGAGYLLSQVRLRGVGLGVAAVLFVGLGLGAWGGERFELPELVGQFGLLLFVYAIGLEAGPGFFRILKERGLGLLLLALGAIVGAGGLIWLAAHRFGLDPALAVGLFCGSLTNTPALAAVSEALRGTPSAVLPTVGYSIAYPLGVGLPILLAELTLRLRRIDVAAAARQAERDGGEETEPASARNLRLTNPGLIGTVLEATPLDDLGVRVSRVQRGDHVAVATAGTVLQAGDILRVVGSPDALTRAERLLGPEAQGAAGPESRRDEVDFRRIILSNPRLVGRRLGDIALENRWEAIVTRIRRGDLDFVPTDDTVLERGDRLRVVARTDQMPAVARYFGDSFKGISETDFLSLSIGALMGVALGLLRVPLPGGMQLQLGLAGGPLLVALVLGRLGRTGPIIWSLPLAANHALRQLGLVLFFAAVGLRSGRHFAAALSAHGPELVAVGAIATLASSAILLWGAMALLRADWVSAAGLMAGGQTQPALLAFANERARSEAPNRAYAAIMPLAMIAKILGAQLLLWWLSR